MDFGESTKLKGLAFIASKFDGILGMAFPQIAVDGSTPFMYRLVEEKLIDNASFTFYLTQTPGSEGSKLTLGGVNPDYFEGEMTYYPLISETYWLIEVDEVKLGETTLKNVKGVVDTGTSVIVGPKSMIAELTKMIPAKPDCQNPE
jgi:cathepsin D